MKISVSTRLLFTVIIPFFLLIWCSITFAAPLHELDEGLERLGMELIQNRSKIGQKRVAIADLSPLHGGMGNLGSFLSEEMFTILARYNIRLLERKLLSDALKELRLNMTDLVDPEHARRFGRFTGTDLLLLGTTTDFPEAIRINARLIDIESRVLVGAGSIELRKGKDILRLMGLPYPGTIQIESLPESRVYLDGDSVGTTDWMGRLKVYPVNPEGHTLTIQKDGYLSYKTSINIGEDEELSIKAILRKTPDPGTAATLSLVFPGAGDLYLGHRDWWMYTLGVGGSIYGAYYYSDKTEDLIWVEDEKGRRLEKRGKGPTYLFAGLAAIIWVYDISHVYSEAKKIHFEDVQEYKIGLEFNPNDKSFIILYRWNLP